MKNQDAHFTHLHLHTDFSLLDGAISLDKVIAFAKEQDFKSLAITDHGNIFGAVKFFQKCKAAGIKPILGIEAYLTEDVAIKDADNKYYHIIILVENEIGYKNLCKLISYSFQSGFYFKPRIDYAALEKYNEGLIVTSACLGGHIPRLIMQDKEKEVDTWIDWYLRVFGKERFYLEIQPEDQDEQKILNKKLIALSKKRNIELVAAGDCHYPSLEDHQAHEVLLSIGTHDKLDNPNRYTFGNCRVYMRTTQEMLDCFPENPEAVWNAGKIADRCNFDFQTGKLFFPQCAIPEEHTEETYFKHLCQKGFENLINDGRINKKDKAIYEKRLEIEINLIVSMGFIGYFLIVSDFIQWARRNDIPVGPGRGSAAGSLVAWCLEITNIDPIQYNLLFERFLNPERITMPDIDIDFCIEGRETVIQYIRDTYGHDKVCQIITFGTLMAKGVIKDVARTLGFSFEDSNAITALIPDQLKITLKEALEQEPRLKELVENNPKAAHLFDIAFKLEGLTRHASKHAAGIVISPERIDHALPIYIPPKHNELVTQYAMTELETLGFLKIDLLGLKNLTLIKHVLMLIKKHYGITLDSNKLPLDDQKTFALICEGKTSGVFQLESSGLKDVLRKLQPEKFEDIIAVNALYRPGPLGSGMVDDYIERRHGRQKITYLFEELKPVLEETYGVIVYQEQVMKIASAIGGYSLGESDILRRAMGKKKVEEMDKQRKIFVERATKSGFDDKKALELFELMAYFAGYGFNKSHSAAYALIAYQTAYLKANYPAEFMACLISLEATNTENMAAYLQEAKDMGLDILPPDINSSEVDFSVKNGNILFGLKGIKSVGMAALENILAKRAEKPFIDLFDMCTRIDLRTCNKRVLEHLIFAGACDSLPGNRAQQHTELETIMERALEKKRQLETGQMGLFDAKPEKDDGTPDYYPFTTRDEWSDKHKLEKEKEVIGCYISAHPLESYRSFYRWLSIPSFDSSLKKGLNAMQEFVVLGCGIIKTRKDIVTKKGDRMAFLQVEDQSGTAEIILFPSVFKKVETLLGEHDAFIIKGALDITSPHKCKIKANMLVPIDLFFEQWIGFEKMALHLPQSIDEALLTTTKKILQPGKVPLELIYHENGSKVRLTTKQRITVSKDIISDLEKKGISVSLNA